MESTTQPACPSLLKENLGSAKTRSALLPMRHNRELASHPPIILVHPVDLGVYFLLSGSRLPISRRHRWACALTEPRLSPKHKHHFVRSTAKARERRRRPALTVDAAPGVEICNPSRTNREAP